jgi:hypothetical protein
MSGAVSEEASSSIEAAIPRAEWAIVAVTSDVSGRVVVEDGRTDG